MPFSSEHHGIYITKRNKGNNTTYFLCTWSKSFVQRQSNGQNNFYSWGILTCILRPCFFVQNKTME